MRLKNIVLQGFKSFADRTNIYFNEGISCIVGPNGSGKSNILDAVKWILGEQNIRELRGEDVFDILFVGSQNRVASNFASVSLTFTDVEEEITSKWGSLSEITVTRKHYRIGDKEYYINNRKCRLKDLKEFFYNIGISSKSIILIEQGKVERIIQSDPEELRQFFEEFAGIVNYREKKKDAQKKLDLTLTNLSRVNDIIIEVEENRKTTLLQRQKLQEYKEYTDKRITLEKIVFASTYKNNLDKLDNLKEKEHSVNSELEVLNKRKETLNEDYNKLIKQFNDNNKDCAILADKLIQIKVSSNEESANIKILENKIELNIKEIDRLEEHILEADKELIGKVARKKQLEADSCILSDKIEELTLAQKDIQKVINDLEVIKNNYNDKLKTIKKEVLLAMDEEKKLTDVLYNRELNSQKLHNDIAYIDKQKTGLNKEFDELENKSIQLKLTLDDFTCDINDINEELSNLVSNESLIKSNIYSINSKLKVIDDELNKYIQRINLLENLIDQIIFGEKNESKKILSKFRYKKVLDIIEDLTYEQVIEYGDIVVFEEAVFKDVITSLAKQNISLRFIFENDLSKFIDTLKLFQCEKINQQVYLSGFIYRSIGGGDKGINLFEYKKELNLLLEKTEKLKEEQKKVADELSILESQKANIFETIEDRKSKFAKVEKLFDSNNQEYQHIQTSIEKIKTKLAFLDKQNEMLLKQFKQLQNECEMAKKNKLIVSEKISSLNDEIKELEEKMAVTQTEYDVKNGAFIEKKLILQNYIKDYEYLLKETSENVNFINKISNDLETSKLRLENCKKSFEEYNSQKEIKHKCLLDFKEAYEDIEKKKLSLDVKTAALQEEINTISLGKESLDINMNNVQLSLNKLSIAAVKIETENDGLSQQYMSAYGKNIFDEYKDFAAPIEKKNTKIEEIKKIEELLNSIGPINMAAEEEYIQLNERIEFLRKQYSDLNEAVGKIRELIDDLDRTSISRFSEALENVRKNFKEVFTVLFNGGVADIRLNNPDNLLNSGVEVLVRPPGKKLQSLNLLSGGEKALVAAALMFAFFLYRKAPFCFLDEIDAPLDDANVNRFLHLVKELSVDTQFIIITHNYTTMAAASSLYGISMSEPGVSTVYSVKLDEIMDSQVVE